MNMDYADALDHVLAQLIEETALVGILAAATNVVSEEQIASALYAVERHLNDTSKRLEGLVTEGKKTACIK